MIDTFNKSGVNEFEDIVFIGGVFSFQESDYL